MALLLLLNILQHDGEVFGPTVNTPYPPCHLNISYGGRKLALTWNAVKPLICFIHDITAIFGGILTAM